MISLNRIIGLSFLAILLVLVVAACQPVMPVETTAPMAEAPIAVVPEVVGTWEMAVDGAPYFLILEPEGVMRIAQGSPDAAPMCTGTYAMVDGKMELACEEVDPTGCTQTQKARYSVAVMEPEGQPAEMQFVLDTVELCTDQRIVLDGMTLTQAETAPAAEAPAAAMPDVTGTWMMEADGTSFFLILEPEGVMRIAQGSSDAAPMCTGTYAMVDGKMELACEEVDPTGCTQTQKARYTVSVVEPEGQPAEMLFVLDTVELCTDQRVVFDGMTLTLAN